MSPTLLPSVPPHGMRQSGFRDYCREPSHAAVLSNLTDAEGQDANEHGPGCWKVAQEPHT